MNWIDIVILAIFFISIVIGLARGLIRETISLITFIAAFVIAIVFTHTLASLFTTSSAIHTAMTSSSSTSGMNTENSVAYLALGISFCILFVGTMFAGSLVSNILNIVFQTGILGFGNRLLGGVFGLVRGFIINLVIIFVIQLTPLGEASWWGDLRFANSFQPAVDWLDDIVSSKSANIKEKFGESLEHVNTKLQSITHRYITNKADR